METTDQTIDEISKDMRAMNVNQSPVYGNMPMYNQIYASNFIVNWKLIIPNNLSVTASAAPIAIIRLSPLMIYRGFAKNIDTAIAISPIQYMKGTYNSTSNFKILSFNNPILPQNLLLSHQYVKGNLNVSVRVNSNVGVSGNLVYTVANNVPRNWTNMYTGTGTAARYNGYDTSLPTRMQAHACKNFAMNDLSLVRHSITSVPSQQLNKFIDQPNFMKQLKGTIDNTSNLPALTNFYTEDIMLVYCLSDITSSSTGPITLDVIYDYTNVAYETPTLPRWFPDPSDSDYYNELNVNQYYYDNKL